MIDALKETGMELIGEVLGDIPPAVDKWMNNIKVPGYKVFLFGAIFRAIFMGEWSAEVMADYIAGPSHVMPTSGTAKFSSSLSVRNFLKYVPVLNFKESTFSKLAIDAELIAQMENLSGHANAAKIRIEKSNG